jgi:hypothetical protein
LGFREQKEPDVSIHFSRGVALVLAMTIGRNSLGQLSQFTQPLATPSTKISPRSADGRYTIIAWNDLGMHCISPRFAEMAILPPYNNIRVIVIQRAGEEPHMVTKGLTVNYSLINNTTTARKTDFWSHENELFGVKLPVGKGLAGFRLSGTMKAVGDHFEANGVPALPYLDDMTWTPYQRAQITLAVGGKVVANTQCVVPVSDEMNCAKCHKTGGVAAKGIATPTMEGNILTLHDKKEKTTLMKQRPVLCASCHSDNALGTKGAKGVQSLSYAMHVKHASVSSQPACYDCHPGAKTQCNRSSITQMAAQGTKPRCDRCHGTLTKVATDLKAGREPWLQEPTCASCHGAQYSTGNALYRNAKGHGGIYCVACHNSPHAWYPSKRADDNMQPQALQGSTYAIGKGLCTPCHTDGRRAAMPPHNED